MRFTVLSRHTVVALVAVLALGAAACGSDPDSSALRPLPADETTPEVAAEPEPEETAVEESTDSDSTDEASTDEEAPEDLAYAESPDRVTPAIDEAVCVALVPTEPAADAIGVVTYRLVDDWAPWQYLALWVPNAAGESALTAGEPSVRNGDSFEFTIDDSMRGDGGWIVDTVTPDGSMLPCAIQTLNGTTAAGLAGSGTAGY